MTIRLARVRKDSSDTPNFVLLSRFDEEAYVRNAHALIKDIGKCAVVVGNRLYYANGTQIHAETTAAEQVKMVAESNFGVEVDLITLSDWKNIPVNSFLRLMYMSVNFIHRKYRVFC